MPAKSIPVTIPGEPIARMRRHTPPPWRYASTSSMNTVMKKDRQKVIFQPSVTSMLRTRTPAVAQHSVAPSIRAIPL